MVGFISALLAPASAFGFLGLTQGLWVQYFYIPQTHRERVRPNPCFFIMLINVIVSKKFSFLTYSKCRYSFSLNKKKPNPGTEKLDLDPASFGVDSCRYTEHYFIAEIREINPLIK